MGTSYRYKCQGCGYERAYYIGGGFLSTEYYEKCKRGEEMLRAAVKAGEYGEVLKTLVDMGKEDFEFSCDEELMQCNNCFQISTILKKRISLWDRDSGFHIDIGFDEPCPFCGKKWPSFGKISTSAACPKCHEVFEMIGIGKWD